MASRVKRNKSKFKWTIQFGILIVFVVALIVSSIVLVQPTAKQKIYKAYQSQATEENSTILSADHVYKGISFNRLVSKLASSDDLLYVYYGSEKCENCVANVEVFNKTAKYFDINTVYYLNSNLLNDYDLDKDADVNKVEALGVKLGGVDLINTPMLLVYKNGELVFDSSKYKIEDEDAMSLSWTVIAHKAFGTDF